MKQEAWCKQQLQQPHDVPDKATRVRHMFNEIAPRYSLVNSLFSGGRDYAWRRKAVQLARISPTDTVLDIACGTGEFALSFAAAGAHAVTGCDFAHGMLTRAVEIGRRQSSRQQTTQTAWCEADALRLPFRSESFAVTSCAFGVRNFSDLSTGLKEMRRVLTPGGRAVILEFTRPNNPLVRGLYELYANRFMPVAATLVSGDSSGAYRYLPRSVVSFLSATEMTERLLAAGFSTATRHPLTLGIVTVYIATCE